MEIRHKIHRDPRLDDLLGMTETEVVSVLRGLVTHYNPFSEESKAICKAIEALEERPELLKFHTVPMREYSHGEWICGRCKNRTSKRYICCRWCGQLLMSEEEIKEGMAR